MRTIPLHGEITRDGDMLVASIDKLHWSTHAHQLEDLLTDVQRMVMDYVRQLSRRGTLTAELAIADPSLKTFSGTERFQLQVQLRLRIVPEQTAGAPTFSFFADAA